MFLYITEEIKTNNFKPNRLLIEMAQEQIDYSGEGFGSLNNKMRDIEDKQRILKDRIFLIGQNLIEMKDNTNKKILEIKQDVEIMKQTIERLSSFL